MGPSSDFLVLACCADYRVVPRLVSRLCHVISSSSAQFFFSTVRRPLHIHLPRACHDLRLWSTKSKSRVHGLPSAHRRLLSMAEGALALPSTRAHNATCLRATDCLWLQLRWLRAVEPSAVLSLTRVWSVVSLSPATFDGVAPPCVLSQMSTVVPQPARPAFYEVYDARKFKFHMWLRDGYAEFYNKATDKCFRVSPSYKDHKSLSNALSQHFKQEQVRVQ